MHSSEESNQHLMRLRLCYGVIAAVMMIFLVRLFYLQVIRHDYYKNSALTGQFKEYEVPAKRGVIEAHSGESTVPIVLNETKYTLFADPVYVKDKPRAAKEIHGVIGGSVSELEKLLSSDTRYAVLAKKLDKSIKERLEELDIKGIGLREQSYRTYPQGEMAASLIGFVNDDGEGKYGIEQYLDKELRGRPGQLKAITDARGVPLVANPDNIIEDPVDGKRVVLTIDMSMQQQLEDILKQGLEDARSESGAVFVMETNTGAIKAMANYPTYNPADFFNVEDSRVFNNVNVSEPYEIGSIIKPLTLAAAIDAGVVGENTTFYDPAKYTIDNETITNVEEAGGAGERSVADILRLSLNTGTTWLLMQMGGGQINDQARTMWYSYMTDRYLFGQKTGIEQGFEGDGVIPDPHEGYGLNIRYANTTFGQGMTATPVQIGAALASVVNGGNYYQPRLVEALIDSQTGNQETIEPKILRSGVVSVQAGNAVRRHMENVVNVSHRVYGFSLRPGYSVGGKSGTSQVARPDGGYYEDRYDGSFVGFVGGDQPQYVVVVKTTAPKIDGYAGSRAAGPIFSATADMLIDNFGVLPRSN